MVDSAAHDTWIVRRRRPETTDMDNLSATF